VPQQVLWRSSAFFDPAQVRARLWSEAEGYPSLDSGPLRMMASLRGFTSAEMFEARKSLEMAIAGLAAERATGEQSV
jgi:DNA-binding FadR family transcriptional regulator